MSFNANSIKGSKATTGAAYAEDEIIMPQAKGNQLPAIIGVEVKHPALLKTDEKYSGWHISTKSQDALIDIDDVDCIAAQQRKHADGASVAGEGGSEELVERYTPPAPIPISSGKIYFGFNQDTGSAHTYKYKIFYVPRYVKGVQQRSNLWSEAEY